MNKRLENAFVLAKVLEEVGGAWFFATYGLFLVGIHLNEWEFVGVNIVFMTVKTLFDPITGNIGDRFGQKRVYLWGIFMWAIGLFVYGFAKNFVVCAIAESLSGIGAALISEALESWLKNLTDEDTSHTSGVLGKVSDNTNSDFRRCGRSQAWFTMAVVVRRNIDDANWWGDVVFIEKLQR